MKPIPSLAAILLPLLTSAHTATVLFSDDFTVSIAVNDANFENTEGRQGGTLDTILRGIDNALVGGAPLNSHIARMILSTFNAGRPEKAETDLTEREREILALLTKGHIKKEIADRIDVSYHTVDTHVRNIYSKIKVHNLSGAVAKAIQLGLRP